MAEDRLDRQVARCLSGSSVMNANWLTAALSVALCHARGRAGRHHPSSDGVRRMHRTGVMACLMMSGRHGLEARSMAYGHHHSYKIMPAAILQGKP
jgi:hypothetical protein